MRICEGTVQYNRARITTLERLRRKCKVEVDSEYTTEIGVEVKFGFYCIGDKESLKVI